MNYHYLGAAILVTVLNAAIYSFYTWRGGKGAFAWGVGATLGAVAGILLERAMG